MRRDGSHIFLPFLLGALLLLAAGSCIFIGAVHIPAKAVIAGFLQKAGIQSAAVADQSFYDTILWQLRLPRIVVSLLAGASLALCGCVFQSIFRNPVCDPYMLGISSGASLGAAVAFLLGLDTLVFGVTLPALATALLTLFLIMGISAMQRRQSTQTLLLIGIALNFLISAVITLLMVINRQEMQKIFFWTMGSVASATWTDAICICITLTLVALVLFYYAKDLNIIQLESDAARTLGVDTQRATHVTLIAASVLTAVVVSFCGVIGFIGLIVPHITRLIFGSDNRRLFTYSLFFGAFFLLIADTLARTLAAPSELPVGSITALAGAPYFIFLLLRKTKI
jgi:iron complex transport system permease protein